MWRCDICGHRQDEGADADCPKCGMRCWSGVVVQPRPLPKPVPAPRCNLCGQPSARLMRRAVCPECEAAQVQDDYGEPPSGAAVCGMIAGVAVFWACSVRGLLAFLGY